MKTYKISPTGANAFAGTNLDDLQSFSINETAETTTLGSDGLPYMTASLVDNIIYNVTVTGLDTSIKPNVGSGGSLVLVASQRDNEGSGVETGTVTYTFAQAVLTDVSTDVNHSGAGSVTFTFSCHSSDGTTSPVAIS